MDGPVVMLQRTNSTMHYQTPSAIGSIPAPNTGSSSNATKSTDTSATTLLKNDKISSEKIRQAAQKKGQFSIKTLLWGIGGACAIVLAAVAAFFLPFAYITVPLSIAAGQSAGFCAKNALPSKRDMARRENAANTLVQSLNSMTKEDRKNFLQNIVGGGPNGELPSYLSLEKVEKFQSILEGNIGEKDSEKNGGQGDVKGEGKVAVNCEEAALEYLVEGMPTDELEKLADRAMLTTTFVRPAGTTGTGTATGVKTSRADSQKILDAARQTKATVAKIVLCLAVGLSILAVAGTIAIFCSFLFPIGPLGGVLVSLCIGRAVEMFMDRSKRGKAAEALIFSLNRLPAETRKEFLQKTLLDKGAPLANCLSQKKNAEVQALLNSDDANSFSKALACAVGDMSREGIERLKGDAAFLVDELARAVPRRETSSYPLDTNELLGENFHDESLTQNAETETPSSETPSSEISSPEIPSLETPFVETPSPELP
ncbi:MAG: hypothetical protein LBT98_01130 [Puniceicoccales bacterium]|jgi:hypothetical protein|nr:hypothetical protein [Puniceicoccales bacterium]